MTILYDIVSLLRVFSQHRGQSGALFEKGKWRKGHNVAPNRVLRTGRRIKSVLKHVSRTFAPLQKHPSKPGRICLAFARKETSLRSSSTTKGHACLILMRQHAAFGSPALVERLDSTSRAQRQNNKGGQCLKRRKSNFLISL